MTARLTMRGVRKSYGAVAALSGVDLTVEGAEVHALIGENGAGKSTLMKVLSGAVAADAGAMAVDGTHYAPTGPRDALGRGIAMIYQELTLAPDLTVAQNVLLGQEPHRAGWVDRAACRDRTRAVLGRLGHGALDPATRVGSLGPGARQLVEVARALASNARIVVMDEPTSSLSRADTEVLFEAIGRLAADGVSVIYISHFLEEVARIAQRYTVIRDGRTVASGEVAESTPAQLVEAMVGRALQEIYPVVPHSPGEPILELDGVGGERAPREASLVLRRGEILGIAGLVGAGRSELLRAVFGLEPVVRGRVRVQGLWDAGRTPWQRIQQGVGLLSEDRKHEGLALSMSLADNLTLSHLERVARYGVIDRAAQQGRATRWIEALAIRSGRPALVVNHLSGGNQQKVALGRMLDRDLDVLLLDEPTRGVDVGSRAEIYRLIGELAAQQKAVLVVSSYVPELLGLCDRVVVMHRGALGTARPANEWTEASVLDAAARGEAA